MANAGMTRNRVIQKELGGKSFGFGMVRVVGMDYDFEHRVGAGNAATILPNDKQAYRCDPLGVVAEERLPPLRWGLLCLAINNAVNCFGEPGALDLVRRDAD